MSPSASTYADPGHAQGMGLMVGPLPYADWTATVQRLARLPGEVPRQIASAFEVYVLAIMYGWLSRPLFTSGTDQISALRETMARTACERHGASARQTRTLAGCLDYLVGRGLVPAERRGLWDDGRAGEGPAPVAGDELQPEQALGCITAFVEDARLLFPAAPR